MSPSGSKRSGYTDRVTPEERIQRLESGVQHLLEEVERLPADVLYREPGPGEWPVMSTLAHVSELLPYWAHQAENVARSPGMAFGRSHDDPRRIGAIEQHGRDSLEAIVARIRAGLDECLETLRSMPAHAWSATGQHPTRGTMTVEELVDAFLVNHIDEHTAQTRATAAVWARQPP